MRYWHINQRMQFSNTAYLEFEASCEKFERVWKLSKSTPPTIFGPITNDNATPREPQSDATAVAVVRSLLGNHADDSIGGAACVTGPARPFKNCPVVIVLGGKKQWK